MAQLEMAQLFCFSQEQLERSRPFFSRAFFSRERGVRRVADRKVWCASSTSSKQPVRHRNSLCWSDGQGAKVLRLAATDVKAPCTVQP